MNRIRQHIVHALLLLATLSSFAQASQIPQPMRFVPGSYHIGPGGGFAAAECAWFPGDVPVSEPFVHVRGTATVQKFVDGSPLGPPVPLSEAMRSQVGGDPPWVKISGNRAIDSVRLEAAHPQPGVTYQLTVTDECVVWDEQAEQARKHDFDLAGAIQWPRSARTVELDELFKSILINFDPTDPQVQDLRSLRQAQEWALRGQMDGSSDLSDRFDEWIRDRWRIDGSAEATVGLAESVRGRLLSESERHALGTLLNVDLSGVPATPPGWAPKAELHPFLRSVLGSVADDIPGNTFWVASDAPELLSDLIEIRDAHAQEVLDDATRVTTARDTARFYRGRGWHESGSVIPDALGQNHHPAIFQRSRQGHRLATSMNRLPGEPMGWGDLITLRLADDTYLLVDMGRGAQGVQQMLSQLKRDHDGRPIRLVVIASHQDADHYNPRAIQAMAEAGVVIERIVASWVDKDRAQAIFREPWFRDLGLNTDRHSDWLREAGITNWVRDGRTSVELEWINREDVTATFDRFRTVIPLADRGGPIVIEFARWRGAKTSNQSSLVMSVLHNGVRTLLTGDIDRATIDAMMAAQECRDMLAADILKWPHHCEFSEDSRWRESMTEMLRRVDPCRVVLSNAAHRRHLQNARHIEVFVSDILPNCRVLWTDEETRSSWSLDGDAIDESQS